MKGLCRFVCATQSSSLHVVVTVRCGAVLFDEGRVRCYGCCAPQPFIASAPSFFFFSSRWIYWRSFGFGACFTALRLVCRLRCFHVVPKRLMGCLPFFLRPAASLVWSWRQQWDSAAACLPCVSHPLPLFPRCVGGGGGERLRRWSCAPVGEGRHRPPLTATVFASGDLTG
ncbi:hypothetical protein TCDM_07876 [Trypanosoma cruzi Dm28c]|uniref:Uncharacterized protein n=1 Tax=Trypanosoma cruzi Dm28c TaxID=1416333 RepID=V5ATJ8_TRYCR|nr:hypothetical protein TCDM_07876 [Trypanosoma cruzi Dm28c]